ncbi:alpha/beta fold hydrolase [Chungangia koreensis]|uniref:Alpha/beta fold hydrolase n=1 Tax=Chungangia koreensis TaxID=752657 RepID=A0ABV8X505_9LACT
MILHTNVIGTGESIVFLHTGLQTGKNDFTVQQEHFKEQYKVFSPDLRGHGKSVGDVTEHYFADAAKDLYETLNHHDVKMVNLVGCSLGALVAVKFAQLFPELVKSLTVSGITIEKPDNWLELHASDVAVQSAILKNEEFINHFNQLHDSDWRQFLELGRREDWYPFEDMQAFNHFSFPVLLLVGERQSAETAAVELFPENNENVHIAIIPFAGHLVHDEQTEIYVRVLEDFLLNCKKSK